MTKTSALQRFTTNLHAVQAITTYPDNWERVSLSLSLLVLRWRKMTWQEVIAARSPERPLEGAPWPLLRQRL